MKKFLFVLSLFHMLNTSLVSQNIPYGVTFQVNNLSDNNMIHPVVTILNNGNIVICWANTGNSDEQFGIYVCVYNAFGEKIVNQFLVSSMKNRVMQEPAVTALREGHFLVCYRSDWNDPTGPNIYYQLCDDSGLKIGEEVQVNLFEKDGQISPQVATLTNGNIVICWKSWGDIIGKGMTLVAQVFDESLNRIGEEIIINSEYTQNSAYPVITALSNRGFLICWQHDWLSKQEIHGQIFEANGLKIGTEFKINTEQSKEKKHPFTSSLNKNRFIVTWQSSDQDGSGQGIFAKIFHNNSKVLVEEFQVNTSSEGDQLYPIVTELNNGDFIISWRSNEYLYFKIYNSEGIEKWNEIKIKLSRHSTYKSSFISSFNDSGFVVVSSQDQSHTSNNAIFVRYLTVPRVLPLSEYYLLWPENDQSFNSIKRTFIWQRSLEIRECYTFEILYNMYIDTDLSFLNPHIIYNLEDTTHTIDSLSAGAAYVWKVLAKNIAGDSLWSSNINGFAIKPGATSVIEIANRTIYQTFKVTQNYPNPFNAETEISYYLPTDKQNYPVKLMIYDLLGRLIKILELDNKSPGHHSVVWDGIDGLGNAVPSGVYIYVLQVGDFKDSKKLVLMR